MQLFRPDLTWNEVIHVIGVVAVSAFLSKCIVQTDQRHTRRSDYLLDRIGYLEARVEALENGL